MGILATIAERRIQEAINRGELDDLTLKGKPIDRENLSDVPDELRMGYKILRNAGMVPEELELRREILTLRDLVESCKENGEQEKALRKRLSLRQLHYDVLRDRNSSSPAFRRYQGRIERKLGIF